MQALRIHEKNKPEERDGVEDFFFEIILDIIQDTHLLFAVSGLVLFGLCMC